MEHEADTPTIVVGVDGSPGSDAALRYAVDDARRRHAGLRVVAAWDFPTPVFIGAPRPSYFADASEQAARSSAQAALAAVGPLDDLAVDLVVANGPPSRVLVDQSRDAELLVVGSRGHGGVAELLLGSVSEACMHHAACPVVVVPKGRTASGRQAEAAA